jgi:ABC-type transport system involved in multi-copper enzyme maturation permease subunit
LLGLVKNECYKVFRRGKFALFLGAVPALQIITVFQVLTRSPDQNAAELNGQSFPLHMIGSQPLIMALFIAVIAADLMAEEYRSGTLKLALLRPVGRSQVMAAKAVALVAAVIALAGFSVMAAYATGTLAFGWGDRLLAQGGPIAGSSFAVSVTAAAASIAPCAGFGMLVLFIALLTENAGLTIGIAAALYLFLPLLRIDPDYSIVYLMNTFHWAVIRGASLREVLADLGVIAAYMVLFYAAGAFYMKRKDVLL